MNFASSVSALRHRRFRTYFIAQAISILGGFIQQVALSWLVFRLTGSSELLGITAFCSMIPQLFLGPVAGAWIDRSDKRKLLILVESLMAVQALGLALLTWNGMITPGMIVAMSLLYGILNAVDLPTRQSLLLDLVGGRQDLGSAIALNAVTFNIGRFIGPPIAGVLVGLTSEAACFALNGLTFAVLIGSVLRMRIESLPNSRSTLRGALTEGLEFMAGNLAMRSLLLHLMVFNLTSASYVVLLPMFAKLVFGGNAITLGLLWGAAGGGALAGTLFLGTLHTPPRAAAVIPLMSGMTALSLVAIALTGQLAFALLLLALLGFALSITNVGTNTVLQGIAPDALRGRVVSVFAGIRFGFDAFGGLLAGLIAGYAGAPATLLGEGVLLGMASLWLLRRRNSLRKDVERQHQSLNSEAKSV
jgi:MFS family permease